LFTGYHPQPGLLVPFQLNEPAWRRGETALESKGWASESEKWT